MSLEFLQSRFEKVNYLATILSARASGNSADDTEYMKLRHELLSDNEISQLLPSFVRMCRDLGAFWSFIQPKFKSYAERRTFISEEFTKVLDYLEGTPSTPSSQFENGNGRKTEPDPLPTRQSVSLRAMGFIPQASEPAQVSRFQAPPPPTERNKRKVFVVHGRDDAAKQEVARFIEELGLEAIILHEQASQGMTIIEKIERYANDADFAIVLYTPCDFGRGAHEGHLSPKKRARQNVVFEHGLMIGKLGRENVCALVKDEIETPNDISGVVYVTLDSYGGWKSAVSKELKACGYTIKS
ncbi:TIR domain-containing protein [Duganella sp. FT27W]|uniref:TIR domain-containing protein n=1 Tax=Duganella sp. FT27W TaxID=2654636 RepID=UPI00128C559B|nr:nucleotide-binding protein [Duganella sp. FT27W]MPQ56279.1 hypothetical protein [Duganella sp. FT27W]